MPSNICNYYNERATFKHAKHPRTEMTRTKFRNNKPNLESDGLLCLVSAGFP